MDIRERMTGPIAIVELIGRLTINDQPGLLKDTVTSALSRGARHVLLDLSHVNYIDSTRLGELIAVHISVSRQKGMLRLVGTPPRILELLSIAGLEGVFQHYPTEADACQGLP
jgi:anti-anti-sigma factor